MKGREVTETWEWTVQGHSPHQTSTVSPSSQAHLPGTQRDGCLHFDSAVPGLGLSCTGDSSSSLGLCTQTFVLTKTSGFEIQVDNVFYDSGELVLWPFIWKIYLRGILVSEFQLSGSKCSFAGGLPEVTIMKTLTRVMTFCPRSLVIMDLVSQLYFTSTQLLLPSRSGFNSVENQR